MRKSPLILGKGHKLDGGISATTIIKIKGTNDNMGFIASVSGSDWKDETFNKYGIKYSDQSTPSTSGNQYYDNAPNKEMTASLNAIYVHRLTKFSELSFFYKFDRHYRKTTSSLYLLDRLDESDALEVGYTYNTKTGVRTYKPCNVNGNYNIGVGYDYERPIDKRRLLDLKTKTRIAYLSNITSAINAQGRTETWTNTLLRYVMFHVAWNMTTKRIKN